MITNQYFGYPKLECLQLLVKPSPDSCWLHFQQQRVKVQARLSADNSGQLVVIMIYLVFKLIGPWGIWLLSQISKFQTHFNNKYLQYFLWNCYQVNATTPHWSLVNIGSGNGLVPSGKKPLTEPMMTCCHKASLDVWLPWVLKKWPIFSRQHL